MSATPYVPFLAAAKANVQIPLTYVKSKNLRTKKRFILYGTLPKMDFNYLPNETIAFTTQEVEVTDFSPSVITLNSEVKGARPCQVVHPNLCFGYNPPNTVRYGFISFTRTVFSHCNEYGFVKAAMSTSPEYESVVQALGRIVRNVDATGFIVVS